MMKMMTMMVMNLGQLTECDENPDSNNAKDGRFVPASEQQFYYDGHDISPLNLHVVVLLAVLPLNIFVPVH